MVKRSRFILLTRCTYPIKVWRSILFSPILYIEVSFIHKSRQHPVSPIINHNKRIKVHLFVGLWCLGDRSVITGHAHRVNTPTTLKKIRRFNSIHSGRFRRVFSWRYQKLNSRGRKHPHEFIYSMKKSIISHDAQQFIRRFIALNIHTYEQA
jgi:hypothetical protein